LILDDLIVARGDELPCLSIPQQIVPLAPKPQRARIEPIAAIAAFMRMLLNDGAHDASPRPRSVRAGLECRCGPVGRAVLIAHLSSLRLSRRISRPVELLDRGYYGERPIRIAARKS
jgi:hypothetical protein